MGMGGISVWQLLIILVIVLLIFGTKRLTGLGSDLGNAIKGFRGAMKESDAEAEAAEPQKLEQADAKGAAAGTTTGAAPGATASGTAAGNAAAGVAAGGTAAGFTAGPAAGGTGADQGKPKV